MSDDATPRLSLPYLAAGQAQKHVTLNEALALLDGLIQMAAESRTTDAQPGAPADGALWIMTAAASGADWAGEDEGAVLRFEAGAWDRLALPEGTVVWVKDEATVLVFDGAAWVDLVQPPTELQDMDLLGVNATADATNKLSVASEAVLFSHDGDDARVKVNKAAAGDTASHLFQTGFSGRAEFGLTGDDDFHLKVSADGASWHDVMSVARATGQASFTLSAMRAPQVDVFTSSGTYTVPAWARVLRILCIAGGGGGGSGAAGTNAAGRHGGSGGGGGGRSEEWFSASELAGSLTVTVGAGGTGGTGVTGTTNGADGGGGGATSVSSSGAVVLEAQGGDRGRAGATTNNVGGWGGRGNFMFSNMGGRGDHNSGLTGLPLDGGTAPDLCDLAAPGGGGGGGGVTTADVYGLGNAGGWGYMKGGAGFRGARGATSAVAGNGNAGGAKGWVRGAGGGGSGGGGNALGAGGTGGAGGAPGGGGGGGGGCRNAYTSGGGGAGGRGEVVIVAYG